MLRNRCKRERENNNSNKRIKRRNDGTNAHIMKNNDRMENVLHMHGARNVARAAIYKIYIVNVMRHITHILVNKQIFYAGE